MLDITTQTTMMQQVTESLKTDEGRSLLAHAINTLSTDYERAEQTISELNLKGSDSWTDDDRQAFKQAEQAP